MAGSDGRFFRQEDSDRSPVGEVVSIAGDLDGATMFADDAAAYPEAKTGAALSLGGEEWLEEL